MGISVEGPDRSRNGVGTGGRTHRIGHGSNVARGDLVWTRLEGTPRTATDADDSVGGDGLDGAQRRGTDTRGGPPAEVRVAAVMNAVPRADSLPAGLRHRAGVDSALPLHEGSSCSQPSNVRDMLTLLDVEPGQRVLDV